MLLRGPLEIRFQQYRPKADIHRAYRQAQPPAGEIAATIRNFLCGVDHRQDMRCCAMVQRRCLEEVRCVRLRQRAKAFHRVHALGANQAA
jgi:hypothetical protein